MKKIICGEIGSDMVMRWCQRNTSYLQHDQFMYGYNWASVIDPNNDIIFTNNDHFLNGVRIAVLDGKLDPKDIEIEFWPSEGPNVQYGMNMFIDKNGRIDEWPEGFFDEMDKALMRLLEGEKERIYE
jgi:hypothetical protein